MSCASSILLYSVLFSSLLSVLLFYFSDLFHSIPVHSVLLCSGLSVLFRPPLFYSRLFGSIPKRHILALIDIFLGS